MNRRDLLKYLMATPLAATMDYEKLLWIPGEKKIFLPKKGFTIQDIVDIELRRIAPFINSLFERDNTFYVKLFEGDRTELARHEQKLINDILEVEYKPDIEGTK